MLFRCNREASLDEIDPKSISMAIVHMQVVATFFDNKSHLQVEG